MSHRLRIVGLCALLLGGCAEADSAEHQARQVVEFSASFDQTFVLPSSVLRFPIANSSNREATGALVSFVGDVGRGTLIVEEVYAGVERLEEGGDLVVSVRVFDGLWAEFNPSPSLEFTGDISIELDDQIGIFGRSEIQDVELMFLSEFPPLMDLVPDSSEAYVDELLEVRGTGFLRPEEGTVWAVVDSGTMRYPDQTSRRVTNARVALRYDNSRTLGFLPVSPTIFGVRLGRFEGDIHFESELRTGERFVGSTHSISVDLKRSRIDTLTPEAGSRGQKITVFGRGFVAPDDDLGYGMYIVFDGVFDPDDPTIPVLSFEGDSAFVKVPYRVVNETTIEQDVWYTITPNGQLDGLGATPGLFTGTITPVLFDAQNEEPGETWTGEFRVLPTKQVVYLKYLPGFSKALQEYGLKNLEPAVRDRIRYVLSRDYADVHVEFRDSPPGDFIEYTTLEIGGPDPSGLLNFGYDNSFNDGGKDIGNLYLGDYLGGVNRQSQSAGYLPYGGVFIESFIAFSPKLFPDNFGTSKSFDVVLSAFMPSLGGAPATADELSGPRATAAENAVNLIGNLTGSTASHEIGHSLGLAHFPATVSGYDERFHNDPPGLEFIMDAGSDRPFEERAELDGQGPAAFNEKNLRYLRRVLPLP